MQRQRSITFQLVSLLILALLLVACGGGEPDIPPTLAPVQLDSSGGGEGSSSDADAAAAAAAAAEQAAAAAAAAQAAAEAAVASNSEGSGGGEASAAPQTLTVSFPGDTRSETMEQIIDSFIAMKASQGVLVTVETNQPTEGYLDQLLLDFTANVGPDVMSLSAETIPELVSAEYLMPLDSMVAGWDEWGNFPDGMKEMTTFNGQLYGIQYDTDARLIYYRKDVFEQAGLPVPWSPFSWNDVLGAAAQIRDTVPGVVPMEVQSGTVWGEATSIGGFFMLFRGAGGVLLDPADGKWIVESPAIQQSFEFYEQMFGDGLSNADFFMEPEPWVPYLQEGFPNGEVGLLVSGSFLWGLYSPTSEWAPMPDRDEVVGWAPMPAREPGAGLNGRNYVSMGGGWGWSIANGTDTPELAQEFVKFMASAESISRYVNAMGTIPARTDAVSDEEFFNELAVDVLPSQSFLPRSPDYARVSAEIQLATEKIMLGEATGQQAMVEFGQAVEAMLGADNVKRLP